MENLVFHTSSPSLVAVLNRMAFFCASELRLLPVLTWRTPRQAGQNAVKCERARRVPRRATRSAKRSERRTRVKKCKLLSFAKQTNIFALFCKCERWRLMRGTILARVSDSETRPREQVGGTIKLR